MARNRQRGQAILTVLIALSAIAVGVIARSADFVSREARLSQDLQRSQSAYFSAESAAEDAAYRLKRGYAVTSGESVIVGSTTVPISLVSVSGLTEITATGTLDALVRAVRIGMFVGEGVDFFYGIHAGASGVSMNSNSTVNGNVFSNASVSGGSNSRIVGSATAVGAISSPNPTVTGTKTTGSSAVALPDIDEAYWKAQANSNNNPYSGDLNYNGNGTYYLGPRKIDGSLNLNSNAALYIQGPIHVTGNLALNSNSDMYLDPSFGSSGTVIIVDGTISINSNADVHATAATPKGYILLVSLAGGDAIQLNSNSSSVLVLAPNGNAVVNSNARVVSVAAKGITLNSNATIDYDSGLADATFSSGPSGGWQFQGWREVAE